MHKPFSFAALLMNNACLKKYLILIATPEYWNTLKYYSSYVQEIL